MLQRLASGENPSLLKTRYAVGCDLPPGTNQIEKPLMTFGDHALGKGTARLVHGLERRGIGLQGAAFHLIHLNSDLVQQAGNLRPLHDDTDRPRDGVAPCNDVIRPEPGDVGRRCSYGPELRDDRLLFRKPAQRLVDGLTACRRSAGTVDVNDDPGDVVRLAYAVDQLQQITAFCDHAFERHTGDLSAIEKPALT